MSQQNLMILPTLSSNISFHTNIEIHYVDITAPFKQEKKHRLRHSHTTHITHMWVSSLYCWGSELICLACSSGPFALYKLLTSTSVVSQFHRKDLLSWNSTWSHNHPEWTSFKAKSFCSTDQILNPWSSTQWQPLYTHPPSHPRVCFSSLQEGWVPILFSCDH